MPIDLQRVLEVAAKTAVEQAAKAAPARKPKKRRLSTGRAMLLGAGLATAGRLVVTHKGRDILGRVQERIADSGWLPDREPGDAEDFEDDEPENSGDEDLAPDDEEVMDDSPDLDREPDADPEEDDTDHEDAIEDEEESPDTEPRRPPRRRTRQRGRA